jgi:hypothetical protein
MTSESKQTYKCQYCGKAFAKESTLASHACEQKRRAQQQNETGVQLGFKAYLRFYQTTQGAGKIKTYEDFAGSPYYTAFVKFGRHLVGIRAVNPTVFIDWLLKNNKKLDYWTKDAFYAEWLAEYMKKENPQDALERALKEMTSYAEDHPELKNGYRDYFRYANGNRICYHISTGRISPWVVFNCESGVAFLDTLSNEQVEIILPWIDPDYWQKKFRDYPDDVTWVKSIMEAAGL